MNDRLEEKSVNNLISRLQFALVSISMIFFMTAFAAAQTRVNPGARGQASQKTPPSSKPTGSGGATKPTGSNLSAQQQHNIEKLQSDLNAIKQGSQVTQSQITALKNDLMAMAEGATKPDPALVEKLATDLANALADGKLSNAEKAKLSQDLYAVMNSANISTAEVNKAIADAQAILQASGITKAEVTTIVNDLKAIAAEAKSNMPSSSGKFKGRKPGGK